eukprot:753790-Hanusia_phi.AAC.5
MENIVLSDANKENQELCRADREAAMIFLVGQGPGPCGTSPQVNLMGGSKRRASDLVTAGEGRLAGMREGERTGTWRKAERAMTLELQPRGQSMVQALIYAITTKPSGWRGGEGTGSRDQLTWLQWSSSRWQRSCTTWAGSCRTRGWSGSWPGWRSFRPTCSHRVSVMLLARQTYGFHVDMTLFSSLLPSPLLSTPLLSGAKGMFAKELPNARDIPALKILVRQLYRNCKTS